VTDSYQPPRTHQETVVRGTLFSLIVIPVGILVFVLISSVGFIASITGFLVAYGAAWLYGKGTGGAITRAGAWVITGVVAVTLLLSFYVSMVVDFARAGGSHFAIPATQFFSGADFWPLFNQNFGDLLKADGVSFLIALALGILGSYRVLRRAFAMSALAKPPTATPYSTLYGSPENEADGAPSASADDKTKPPTPGS
jgi:hypothetical protein